MHTVLLIQPLGSLDQPGAFMRTCSLEPLALEYLQAELEQINVVAHLFYGRIDENALFQAIEKYSAVAVGFSVYSYQYAYSLELAGRIKEKNKDVFIIFGGYHPSALPDKVIVNEHVDFVIAGEGEVTFRELIAALINNQDVSRVKGIWYKDAKSIPTQTERRERVEDIDRISLPVRHQEVLSHAIQYQVAYPAPSAQVAVAQVAYSRGCPFACSFCSSKNMWGEKVIWRSPAKVLDEIEMLYKKFGTNLIYFPDLTFNMNEDKVHEICDEFIRRDLPIHWWGLFRLDRLTVEMLHKLKAAKCFKLSIGFERASDSATEVKGNYRVEKEHCTRILQVANDIGLIIKAFLIIGFPDDTIESIHRYKDFLFENNIDEVRVTFIAPFPGTQIWDDYRRNGFLSDNSDLSRFTTEVPVIRHPHLDDETLFRLRAELVLDFYHDARYAEHVTQKITKHPHLKNSYLEYFQFLYERGIIDCKVFLDAFPFNR